MKHLEAWHTRHEMSKDAKEHLLSALFTADDTPDDMELSDSDEADLELDSSSRDSDTSCISGDLVRQLSLNMELPKWFCLKEESKIIRQDKALQTRERNKRLRELTRRQDFRGIALRGHGRSPKSQVAKDEVPKHPRGRPPKSQVGKSDEVPKRRRGRPPKASSTATRIAETARPITRRSTRTRAVTQKPN